MNVQRDDAWVKAATAQQIVDAQTAGELDALLGRKPRLPTTGQLTAEDLKGRSAEEIENARSNEQLSNLLGNHT
jgi:hypothetical protein